MPVLAGIVGDMLVITLAARSHMPAKRLRATGLNRRHNLELAQADMPGIGSPPREAIFAKDVSNLQL